MSLLLLFRGTYTLPVSMVAFSKRTSLQMATDTHADAKRAGISIAASTAHYAKRRQP